ncbi:hypothetical protein H0486_10200 [Lachnospiraceae bacterium MD1]|uniref:Uncharacterized protein n=1 Tax=Variimorphobacter saccharofermentans TaxID=2755051 RepID=A0A839K0S4_9FIRM|nr:hypothetical protein [Variimorphobacter saccharofermentans]MBB2183250.1 hypothetical protein [Variimorphobacter saccharofermentans]
MNSIVLNFHTLIRKYCMERIQKLKSDQLVAMRKAFEVYDDTKDMTEEETIQCIHKKMCSVDREKMKQIVNNEELRKYWCAVNIDILDVMLKNIEKVEPEEFSSVEEIRKKIINIVKSSKISGIKGYDNISNDEKENICEKEKQICISYMNSIHEEKLRDAPQLFYRRVISKEKEAELISDFEKQWLNKVMQHFDEPMDGVLRFHIGSFTEEIDLDRLTQLLIDHGDERIYEINSCEVDAVSYIMDTNVLCLKNKTQAYWFSEAMDWAIIKDHSSFVFLCGGLLINAYNSDLLKKN